MDKQWLRQLIIDTRLIKHHSINSQDKQILTLFLEDDFYYKKISKKLDISEIQSRRAVQNALNSCVKASFELFENQKAFKALQAENKILVEILKKNGISWPSEEIELIPRDFGRIEKVKISKRVKSVFQLIGIDKISDLNECYFNQILDLPNVGKKTIADIIDLADKFGVQLNEK